MGARKHGQGSLVPPGKVVKCFDASVLTVKCSVYELFMHYFQNIRRLLGASPPYPYQGFVYGPRWGTKAPGPLICPPLEEILRAPMDDDTNVFVENSVAGRWQPRHAETSLQGGDALMNGRTQAHSQLLKQSCYVEFIAAGHSCCSSL